MSEDQTSRRKFLELVGLTAGATLLSTGAIAGFVNHEDIRRLKPDQQEFMLSYGSWMNEFMDVINIQKSDPDNYENQQKMIALTEQAEVFQPKLKEFMKDETFALIYHASIQKMRNEI